MALATWMVFVVSVRGNGSKPKDSTTYSKEFHINNI